MDYDGTLVIGTDLDESGIDKRVRKLEAKLKNEEIDLEIKATNVDNVKKEMQQVSNEMKVLIKQRDELNKSIASKKSQYDRINSNISAGKSISPEEYLRYGNLENQLSKLYAQQNQINAEVDKYNNSYNKLNDKLSVAEAHYDKQKNKVAETRAQVEDLRTEISKTNLENIKQQSNGIGNSIENIVKKVTKWGLAIFGVRSAYMFIRQAMGTLSQYNEKLGADVQYIRFALATALQPVIEKIIDLVYKMLAYINYIAKAWFGVNLFANATSKAFEKANKGVKDTNKSAQKLKKTLAGFDEMNILQEDGSIGSGGGGGGVTLPSSDLSNLDNIEIPGWVQWIADNKDTILNTLKEIGILVGVAFATIKVLEFLGVINKISTALGGISTLATFGVIAGFAATLIGIIKTVSSLITFINDPSWSNFSSVLDGIAITLAGIGVAMVALNASNPMGWITLAIAGITKLIGLMGDAINKDEEKVKSTLSVKDAEEGLAKARNELNSATKNYKNAVSNAKKAEEELEKAEKKHKLSGKELYNQVLTGQLTYDKMNKSQKAVYEAYLEHLEAQGNLKQATDKMTEATRNERDAQEDLSVSTYKYKGQYSDYIKTLIDGYTNGEIKAKAMAEKIMYVMSEMDKDTRKRFAESLPQNIKDGFNEAQKEAGYGIHVFNNGVEISFKEVANAGSNMTKDVGKSMKNVASEIGKSLGTDAPNSIQKSINKVDSLTKSIDNLKKKGNVNVNIKTTTSSSSSSSSSKNAKGGIAYYAKGGLLNLPRLAPGGVINQPGRGVAIGGERGPEAVVPLTDSQQMELLGKAIGKYITVCLTNRTYIGNREVAREMKNIEAEENFAFNN